MPAPWGSETLASAHTIIETAVHAHGGAASDTTSVLQPPDEAVSDHAAADAPSFIETQFPVSRLSKESYKERKANYSQTLTGLGKWWGRKPLVMVRAVILGLLMPASEDPRKDREVFLALLTMDDDGLWRRKRRNIPLKEVYRRLSPRERVDWFAPNTVPGRPRLMKRTTAEAKGRLQRIVFGRMSYDEKLVLCDRPEHVDGPSPEAWEVINEHLGTTAASLPELVRELGEHRFGHVPRVGDAFCGGGSVPFEAARLGCEAFGSDLNPVAALLTWGALNIVGGGEEVADKVRQAQAEVFDAVDRQVTEWRIEHNDAGWRADALLYCTETTCPECGWRVPLAPSWVIGEKTQAAARLNPRPAQHSFAIDIRSGVGREALEAARKTGTVKQSRLECPNPDCQGSTPMAAIRRDRRDGDRRDYGLRLWENEDLVPRPDDVFQERLYCIRWRLPPLNTLLWAEQTGGGERRSTRPPVGCLRPPPVPIPDWVDLDSAITALVALLGPSEQREVAKLRERDWQEENHASEEARCELDKRAEGLPKAKLAKAVGRVKHQERSIAERDSQVNALSKSLPEKLYRTVNDADLEREALVLALLRERFQEWQALGHIPSRPIVSGAKTGEPIRTRGWTHWHHLFTPRQLLVHGKLAETSSESISSLKRKMTCLLERERIVETGTEQLWRRCAVALVLGLFRCADYNSRLSRWHAHGANEKSEQAFSNQALNSLNNYAGKGLISLSSVWQIRINSIVEKPIHDPALSRDLQNTRKDIALPLNLTNDESEQNPQLTCKSNKAQYTRLDQNRSVCNNPVNAIDARASQYAADVWLTDPPYADAINYHELSEFFLAWYEKKLPDLFPTWAADSKRALAIRGSDTEFRRGMADCYRHLAAHMPDNGLQVVMFTHQDASVWADLALILWAAGLRVTVAWTIATETESALKEGNYVQGTVLMVLRKQASNETVFLDEVVPQVELEVERQLESMIQLDDRETPNFSDADYQLAAYAAALRVLTQYQAIDDIDVAYHLAREPSARDSNPLVRIIDNAVRTASNYLIPPDLPDHMWRRLGPEEKLYLKGLEVESHGESRTGVYQEFARGFGVRDYRFLLRNSKANDTRLRTASEFQRRELGDSPFGQSLVRHALYAVWRAAETGDVAGSRTWLRTELDDYWQQREALASVLRYFAAIDMDHWHEDATAARIVSGAVENDHV